MKINISEAALTWFKKEMQVKDKDYIRFFARYGGCGTVQSGFSLGINKEKPKELGASTEIDGITFFIEKDDLWYFDQYDLSVTYNEAKDEIEFDYEIKE